ncbi:MAG: hypothetical protein KME16_01620 [Scytolyngbya sp. HA4215-MV1]|nr:hypothetical protein [Scytolyngbya sp. HA4215-MV1]
MLNLVLSFLIAQAPTATPNATNTAIENPWDLNLFIVAVYLIVVALVFGWMFRSLNDMFEIKLDPSYEPSPEKQMEDQNLTNVAEVKFEFDNRYEFDKFKSFSLNVKNLTTYLMYVDWDKSTVTDFGGGRSRRVIRLAPGVTLDLLQPQASSAISPGRTLKEKFTAEDVLQRKSESGQMEEIADQPVIDIKKLEKGSPANKEDYRDFVDGLKPLYVYVKLAMRVFNPPHDMNEHRSVNLEYRFVMKKLPWYVGLPWNPKK